MDAKNTPNSKDPKKKSSSKWIALGTAAMLTAGVFSTNLNYSQQSNNGLLMENLKKKNTTEFVEKKDTIDHEKIIQMDAEDILIEYGQEKGMEILNEHMLIEINKLREEFNVSELIPDSASRILKDLSLNKKLCSSAQTYAEYMYNNNWYEHRGKDGSTFESRIKKTGYPFNFLGEILYKKGGSISDIVYGRKKSQTHDNVINNRYYLHAGFGYYKGYRVGHFGGQKK